MNGQLVGRASEGEVYDKLDITKMEVEVEVKVEDYGTYKRSGQTSFNFQIY